MRYDTNCGLVRVDTDGLRVRGDLPEPLLDVPPEWGSASRATLVLTKVTPTDMSDRTGYVVSGSLRFPSGHTIDVEGGTDGVAFFTAACRI